MTGRSGRYPPELRVPAVRMVAGIRGDARDGVADAAPRRSADGVGAPLPVDSYTGCFALWRGGVVGSGVKGGTDVMGRSVHQVSKASAVTGRERW